jgi:hypothetical protein
MQQLQLPGIATAAIARNISCVPHVAIVWQVLGWAKIALSTSERDRHMKHTCNKHSLLYAHTTLARILYSAWDLRGLM